MGEGGVDGSLVVCPQLLSGLNLQTDPLWGQIDGLWVVLSFSYVALRARCVGGRMHDVARHETGS